MNKLDINTFNNADHSSGWRPGNNSGGTSLFKALGHPAVADQGRAWRAGLEQAGRLAIYDPLGEVQTVNALYNLQALKPDAYFVQQVEHLDRSFAGLPARLISDIDGSFDVLLMTAFDDGGKLASHLNHVLPEGVRIETLDVLRLSDDRITVKHAYLDPKNFATNFALLRDGGGLHTRVVTANYWSVGDRSPVLWCRLMGEDGRLLAEWDQDVGPAGSTIVIDSQEVRQRFGLGDFCGSLFLHAVGAPFHEIVKYALDVYGDAVEQLSCTHDANAWPAEYYAGVPAPDADEQLVLWVQNSHPIPIPANAIGFNLVGGQDVGTYPEAIPPFGTRMIDVGALLPDARFPDQIEIRAGEYFVRPRYEVIRSGSNRRRIAHANVERTDLQPDPEIEANMPHLGRGYIMPLPVLPVEEFSTTCLPTPMATGQMEMPIRIELFDADGTKAAEKYLGRVQRRDSIALDIDDWMREAGASLPSGTGHVEFLYDFRDGGGADGWLHALARIEQRASGHRAETIFGAHMFNMPIVFRDEPQSYAGRPPGLTTRLFLRLGDETADTMCHLLYPASMRWADHSATDLNLFSGRGEQIATTRIEIPRGGSRHFRYSEVFDDVTRARAGENAYIQIRDVTCRLFGFHGLIRPGVAFSLDHMFGY
ncbi:hypothetical protein [Minwuia sp.]|uniref:hypothetical protein n=1 Tax=Minwuia sp. TaxID=2493630 RepID=UPI003A8E312E